ncbi:hypothetical protein UFOVP613_4 [uncultured Caudovirales phage]|uniref:Uncharacterized protein n=1 Tax=uncultured Caudovirales phage TaxID=2100421 RepID=A0A6J5MYG3_9CAUD|nr:hypothetical protein UFOVP613_4 [uncultured Caudovirales phage]
MGAFKDLAIDEANQAAERRRRGRLNRSRGNALERWACGELGIRRVGHYGGKADGGAHDEPVVISVKSGGAFPERIWDLIQGLAPEAGQIRAAVHVSADGVGSRRRALITLELQDIARLMPAIRQAMGYPEPAPEPVAPKRKIQRRAK